MRCYRINIVEYINLYRMDEIKVHPLTTKTIAISIFVNWISGSTYNYMRYSARCCDRKFRVPARLIYLTGTKSDNVYIVGIINFIVYLCERNVTLYVKFQIRGASRQRPQCKRFIFQYITCTYLGRTGLYYSLRFRKSMLFRRLYTMLPS